MRSFVLPLASAIALLLPMADVLASGLPRPRERVVGPDRVQAESRFGHGTVVGRVRRTELGPQVQLPGGNWVYCRRTCTDTLRVETVDFWENRGGGRSGRDMEQGLFDLSLPFTIRRY